MLHHLAPHRRPTDCFMRDRALGALVGLAVGDALGASLEFAPYDPLRFHSEMIGGGPFGLHPGEWTDDTAMALALADTLIDEYGFSGVGFMTRLASWLRHGRYACQGRCVDIGHSTLASIRRFVETGIDTCSSDDPAGAGNGSLVRLAPVALRYLHDADTSVQIANVQSKCTHSAPAAANACIFVVTLLRELILGIPNATMPRTLHSNTDPEIARIAAGSYLELHDLNPTGHVVRTLETTLSALHHTESFEQALIAATSLGGDADSIGAVTGMLAGATYGLSAIPKRWLHQLAWRDEIIAMGHRLLAAASV